MNSKKERNELKDKNLMELTPIRAYEHNKKDDGLIDVLVPRFTDKFFGKFLQPKLKNKYIRANLDEIGSFTWERIDGSNDVYHIALALKEHFGDDFTQHIERTAQFISHLYRNNFIYFKEIRKDR